MSIIWTPQADQGALIEKVRAMLAEFADPSQMPDEPSGVEMYRFNAAPQHKIMFRFATFDDIEVRVEIDVRDVTRDYLSQIMQGVIKQIEDGRKYRHRGKGALCQA